MSNQGISISYLKSLGPRQLYERLKLVWGLYKDDRVARRHKLVLLLGLAYAAFPLDLIPDFIPVIGMMDDVVITVLIADWFIKLCPAELVAEHRQKIQLGQGDFDEDLKSLFTKIRSELHALFKRTKKSDNL